jgi:hypothetical protein
MKLLYEDSYTLSKGMNDEASTQTFNKLVVAARNTREGSVHRVGSGEYEVERP